LRPIEKPKNLDQTRKEDDQVELEDVLNEKKKKLKEEWQGWPLPETGSKDLDTGLEDEYHYRKSYNDTPANIVAARKEFYDNLPEKLRVARELANRDRLPTKEEQKYPPPTEQELVEDRLNRERRWRNDFHGWLMTRKGSKVTWDSRFETFKVLDLELAKANREKYGHVAEHSS
jgi:import inner membrane translocase subunit TIM54